MFLWLYTIEFEIRSSLCTRKLKQDKIAYEYLGTLFRLKFTLNIYQFRLRSRTTIEVLDSDLYSYQYVALVICAVYINTCT